MHCHTHTTAMTSIKHGRIGLKIILDIVILLDKIIMLHKFGIAPCLLINNTFAKMSVSPLKYMGITLGLKFSQSGLHTLRLRIFKIHLY